MRTSGSGSSHARRFGSNGTSAGSTSIHIAAVGVDVIPAATKDTWNGNDRWLVRLGADIGRPRNDGSSSCSTDA